MPLPVVDFQEVLAAALAYGAAGESSHRGKLASRKALLRWERHCKAGGWDPWEAPWQAFRELWLLRRADGRPLATGTIAGTAGCVASEYARRGLTPAHRRPENAGEWKRLSAGHSRTIDRRESAVVPMLRADALALVSAKLPWPVSARRRMTGYLLMLDGVPLPVLERLTSDDVAINGDGSVSIGVVWIRCDHLERARGVPWACSACSLLDLVADAKPGGLLLREGSTRCYTSNLLRRMRQAFPGLAGSGMPEEGLSDWQLAGLRRALVLSSHCTIDDVKEGSSLGRNRAHVGLRWARARAWTAVAWTCGLRMGADTERLSRALVRPDAAGRGWEISLGQTKDDPWGAKATVRAFYWPSEGGPSVAQALAEYVCVRDALAGIDDLPVFSRLWPGRPGRARTPGSGAIPDDAAKAPKRDLDLLAKLAGLDPVFTSYSPRKGYAAQSDADGRPVEDIQEGLRHASLSTTIDHYMPRKCPKSIAEKAIKAFDETKGHVA